MDPLPQQVPCYAIDQERYIRSKTSICDDEVEGRETLTTQVSNSWEQEQDQDMVTPSANKAATKSEQNPFN